MDFTFKTYKQLLATLQSQGYLFQAVSDWRNESTHEKTILLRHDVEALYNHSLRFAEIQHELGIKGTYYFRLFPHSENGTTIGKIAELGHEIGYHYDDLSICKGDYENAIKRFEQNLNYLRSIAPVKTICMEGAPSSKYNNQDLWKKYSYRDFGITTEPYFDLDFAKLFYLTDTGRRWDGKYAVRDKVGSKEHGVRSKEHGAGRWPIYKTTNDIINAVEDGTFPRQAMLTFHPQRWHSKPLPWLKELVWQNVKNQGKRVLVKLRG